MVGETGRWLFFFLLVLVGFSWFILGFLVGFLCDCNFLVFLVIACSSIFCLFFLGSSRVLKRNLGLTDFFCDFLVFLSSCLLDKFFFGF